MNLFQPRPLLFVTGWLLAATSIMLAADPVPKAVDRFERTKVRIDALLARRLQPPEPLPPKTPNPFQNYVAAPEVPGVPTTPVEPLTDDGSILARYAPGLKVSGQIQLDGRSHIVINASPYTVGDFIPIVGPREATYYFKVIRIDRNQLTLGYNTAELTVPLK